MQSLISQWTSRSTVRASYRAKRPGLGQTSYTPGPGYYGVTRNPNYLHFYNTSFPELYHEPDPTFYARKLKGPVIRPTLGQASTTAGAVRSC